MSEDARPFLAERLRVALAKKDWSGAELARRLGVTRACVAPWLKGAPVPRKQLVAAAEALDVSVSWFLSPYPVDLHGPVTDELRHTLIGLLIAGALSEGQVARATGLDRVEVRARVHERLCELDSEFAP